MKQNGGCVKLYLAFGLKAIADELLEVNMRNVVWRHHKNIYFWSIVYKLIFTNMAALGCVLFIKVNEKGMIVVSGFLSSLGKIFSSTAFCLVD
jgi:hypothetical protein